jgi:Nuclease-related domain
MTAANEREQGPGSGRGRAGASARAEYERRQANDEARRRAVFGPLAPVVRLIAGPKRTTETWGRGAVGEERIGDWLDDAVGRQGGVVLHDRALPRRRANIDHIVVVASGIWVVDTKHYRGRLERREAGGWFVPRPRLVVAGRDRGHLVTAARRQQALVAEALVAEELAAGPLVRAALCFTGVQVGLFTRPFALEGVLITWPRAFARALAASGPLGPAERRALASRLARAFPPYPYAPGGTSHKPTGASPRG